MEASLRVAFSAVTVDILLTWNRTEATSGDSYLLLDECSLTGQLNDRATGLGETLALGSPLHFLPATLSQFHSDGIGGIYMACYEG